MTKKLSSTVTMERRGAVALLWCDNPPVNAISQSIRTGLFEGARALAADAELKAAVLICRGRTFFVGADITEFGKSASGPTWSEADAAIDLSGKPIIAAIHGTCYGGGFEFALACQYRIADPSAQFGFPEVKLGIIPGSGGTQRFPRIAGFEAALEIIPSGRTFGAKEAASLGVVDRIAEGSLEEAALAFAAEIIAGAGAALPRARTREDKVEQARATPQVFDEARMTAAKRWRGRSAPLRAIESIENALRLPFEEAKKAEAAIFDECQSSAAHRALSHLFFAEREARRVPGLGVDTPVRKIEKAAVIGGGTMGRGISLAFADAGIPVRLIEVTPEAAKGARDSIEKELARSVERRRITQVQAAERLALIEPHADLAAACEADLAIEAVFEDMDLKQQVFRGLDAFMPDDAIIASNTSNLDIDRIAQVTERPQDVIGLHFFSPANVMKLLEIVRGAHTSDTVLASALALAKRLGKQPVVARVCDGFIVNRAFGEYWRQTRLLVEEGASPYEVDAALVAFGMPQGPFAISDFVGLDVSKMIRANRRAERGTDPRSDTLEDDLAGTGRLGRKSGAGWYRYENGGQSPTPDPEVLEFVDRRRRSTGVNPRTIGPDEIVERCIYCVINEGAKEIEEGIAIRASDIDVAAVHGYGFPAHRGGPMRYGEEIGLGRVALVVERLYEAQGEAWRPSPLLLERARSGRGFSDR